MRWQTLLSYSAALLIFCNGPARADEAQSGSDTEHSLWSRPSLLDYPGGSKESLRRLGVTLDLSLTQFLQGPVSSDGRNTAQYGGKADIIGAIDLSRVLPNWDGALLTIHQEALFGQDANAQGDGTALPVNTALAFPRLGGSDADTSIVLSQKLSDSATLSLGKLNMLDAAARRLRCAGKRDHAALHSGRISWPSHETSRILCTRL